MVRSHGSVVHWILWVGSVEDEDGRDQGKADGEAA